MMLLLEVDGVLRAHLARALAAHSSWCRSERIPVPPELCRLTDLFQASDGLERTQVEVAPGAGHGGGVIAVTIPEAARRMMLSERQLRRLVSAGRLPVARFGRSVRVPVAALEDLVAGAVRR